MLHKIFFTIVLLTILPQISFAQKPELELELDTIKNQKVALKPDLVSPEKIKDAVNSILLNNKANSLMFDDEESSNIDKAIDSLKNNQLYVPETSENTNKEMSEEDKKAAAEKAAEEEKKKIENEKSYAYLASIIYLNNKEWVIWINQKKITSESNKKGNEIYVKSVNKEHTDIIWKMSVSKWKILSGKNSESLAPKINSDNQVELTFSLKPNQAYSLITNKVIDGKSGYSVIIKSY